MQDGGQALAKAKGAADIKTAATKVNTACNSCHSEWRNK
jgi:cytochrome c556